MHIVIYTDKEKWVNLDYKNIKPMYEISTYGCVRNKETMKLLSVCMNEKGYNMVTLMTHEGESKCFKLHILVAYTFLNKPILQLGNDKYTINHKNGDKNDNSIYNLEWITFSENIRHSYREGLNTPRRGDLNGMCKHSENVIRLICKLLSDGYKPSKIIKDVKEIYSEDINRDTVYDLKYKRRWKHIADEYF